MLANQRWSEIRLLTPEHKYGIDAKIFISQVLLTCENLRAEAGVQYSQETYPKAEKTFDFSRPVANCTTNCLGNIATYCSGVWSTSCPQGLVWTRWIRVIPELEDIRPSKLKQTNKQKKIKEKRKRLTVWYIWLIMDNRIWRAWLAQFTDQWYNFQYMMYLVFTAASSFVLNWYRVEPCCLARCHCCSVDNTLK